MTTDAARHLVDLADSRDEACDCAYHSARALARKAAVIGRAFPAGTGVWFRPGPAGRAIVRQANRAMFDDLRVERRHPGIARLIGYAILLLWPGRHGYYYLKPVGQKVA